MRQFSQAASFVSSLKEKRDTAQPLILVTNDDGIRSHGLHAVVKAVCDLGEVVVAAPRRQFSNAGRHHPPSPKRDQSTIHPEKLPVDCPDVAAYSIDSSPAQTVARAWLEVLSRLPDLVISGINYGENMGTGVTVSGTVGAAIEAACAGIPALAVSLETSPDFHYSPSDDVDFGVAAAFTRQFAQIVLAGGLPPDVDILKIDVPGDATLDTPWRVTRVSRQPYYVPVLNGDGADSDPLVPDYRVQVDLDSLEPDSDIYALAVARVVSVSPMSVDLSSRTDRDHLAAELARRASQVVQA
jgi:5'/3'-nucleotidase